VSADLLYSVRLAMKPGKTLKDLLVHPKDKQDKEDITECVYKVPCARRNWKKVRGKATRT